MPDTFFILPFKIDPPYIKLCLIQNNTGQDHFCHYYHDVNVLLSILATGPSSYAIIETVINFYKI